MHIMFVCNRKHLPLAHGELLMSRYLANTTVQVTSAGTRGLPCTRSIPPARGSWIALALIPADSGPPPTDP